MTFWRLSEYVLPKISVCTSKCPGKFSSCLVICSFWASHHTVNAQMDSDASSESWSSEWRWKQVCGEQKRWRSWPSPSSALPKAVRGASERWAAWQTRLWQRVQYSERGWTLGKSVLLARRGRNHGLWTQDGSRSHVWPWDEIWHHLCSIHLLVVFCVWESALCLATGPSFSPCLRLPAFFWLWLCSIYRQINHLCSQMPYTLLVK